MVMSEEDCTVRVVVRVRPPTPKELEIHRRPVVQVVDERMLVFDPEEPDGGFPGLKWGGSIHDGPKKKGKDLKFVFDHVFAETATQQEVFRHTTHSILDGVLQGYNCSVFAYGATGAGKTHTMLGGERDPGIMYLTMMELYQRLEARRQEKHYEILISYQEVYNEQIHDLLDPKGALAIREDPDKGVVVQGLSFHKPASAEQLLEMLTRGNRNRTQHPTDANATSSRSHAVFQIYVKQQDCVPGLTQTLQVAKMSLIDLAGSERASSTHAKGERLREGANINRSLLALINVLNALADAKGRKTHVPYRDSKLTRLLKDSIGGNCRTVMIAAVSPSALAYEDTYNTLKYADRAKEIKLSLKSNVISLNCHISQYATICQQLQAEVTALREKLQIYEAGARTTPLELPKPSLCISPLQSGPSLPDSPSLSHHPSQSCSPELYSSPETPQEEKVETQVEAKEVMKPFLISQAQEPMKERNENAIKEVPQSPVPAIGPKPGLDSFTSAEVDRDKAKRLALVVLHLAQRQYSLLKEANLLTPDMVLEFEAVQQLVQGENTVPCGKVGKVADTPSPARGVPLSQDLSPESNLFFPSWISGSALTLNVSLFCLAPPTYSGPTTRTMARRLSGLLPILGLPPPFSTLSPQSSQAPRKKKRRMSEESSPPKLNSSSSSKLRAKRQRKSLPNTEKSSVPQAWPSTGLNTPKMEVTSTDPFPHLCSATVIKSRVPLGPSSMQNCSTPLSLPTHNLNATFDLSEGPLLKPTASEFLTWENVPAAFNKMDKPFIPRGPMPLFTMKGPKSTSSLRGGSARKKKRPLRSSASCSLAAPQGRSRIARLHSSTMKKTGGPLAVRGNWQEKGRRGLTKAKKIPELSSSPRWTGSQRSRKDSAGLGGAPQAGIQPSRGKSMIKGS
ncbi:kinesin-like protein KIF18B isoform X1 [Monodelphis domestica]|uniref:kinesin-like protein KIF18B isoform X1 n=1 Tax=Monodelphis domestica TaxID=13616 RepID=UPI0024E1E875|nr:kinesin-like protein KIF18B isoform X1 [Monodelphis domestica]